MTIARRIRRSYQGGAPANFQDYLEAVTHNGFQLDLQQSWGTTNVEKATDNFVGRVGIAYHRNGPVFACILARLMLFSEARFQWQNLNSGRAGDLFGTPELSVLERPWKGATTGELLARMEQDSSLAGNAFIVRRSDGGTRADKLRRLRPDFVTIIGAVAGDPKNTSGDDVDAEVLGYLYSPPKRETTLFMPDEVAHFSPIPDPACHWRGMSWITPIMADLEGDQAMSTYQTKLFERGGTPNFIIKLAKQLGKDGRDDLRDEIEQRFGGVRNAGKTMVLENGADAQVVGLDLNKLTYSAVRGDGENRIASAAGVPPIVVGMKAGLDAATYSNYAQAMRRFGDLTMRPLWRMAAGSLENLVTPPKGAVRLWYDARDIPALAADSLSISQIQQLQAHTIDRLVRAGFEPDSVTAAVKANDLGTLKHSGGIPTTLYPGGIDPEAGGFDNGSSTTTDKLVVPTGNNDNGGA